MGEQSKIQWTHHTFNPWWGCAKVSPGCKHCYAETFAKRVGQKVWGEGGARRLFGEKHWNEPLKWARAAAKAGERHRVFCASMADVFEDHPALEAERAKLWQLIRDTASVCSAGCGPGDNIRSTCDECGNLEGGLDWLLLTKRPENILRMAPADILPMVWVGTTVEDQEHAEKRIPELLKVPARIRFLSCEPLLGPVTLPFPSAGCAECGISETLCDEDGCCVMCGVPAATEPGIDWVIVGGESGPGARPFDLAWARSIQKQCAAVGVACFVKQLGAKPTVGYYDDAAREWFEQNRWEWPDPIGWDERDGQPRMDARVNVRGKDRAGGDPSEWPADLRVRQFPEVRHG